MSRTTDERRGGAPLPTSSSGPESGRSARSELLDRLLAPVVRDFTWRRTGVGGADLEAYCACWPRALRPEIRERCRVVLAVQSALRRLRTRDARGTRDARCARDARDRAGAQDRGAGGLDPDTARVR